MSKTTGIDLVLGGHTHTLMDKPQFLLNAAGHEVPVMHSGSKGMYVGEVKLTLETKK